MMWYNTNMEARGMQATKQQAKAIKTVSRIRRQLHFAAPTRTEQWIDARLAELEDARLIARLAASANWRA